MDFSKISHEIAKLSTGVAIGSQLLAAKAPAILQAYPNLTGAVSAASGFLAFAGYVLHFAMEYGPLFLGWLASFANKSTIPPASPK